MSHLTAAVRKLVTPQALCLLAIALLIGVGLLHSLSVYGDQLPNRSITLSNGQPGSTDTYRVSFTLPNSETLGSVEFQLCSDSPLVGTPCTAPVGSNLTTASLMNQSGTSGFAISHATANDLILSRTAAVAAPTVITFELSGITNPSQVGAYFGRVQTYVSTNASGQATDYGGLAFAINNLLTVNTVVPPYLYFCVGITVTGTDCSTASGNYIDFGNFTPSVASVAQTQMVAGTNAASGYAIVVSGTTLTSGNNVIPELDTPDTSRPGTSQFGMNLVANQDPQVGQNPSGPGSGAPATGYGQANQYKFTPGDVVATALVPDFPRNYTTSYITNIAKGQAPGVYVTTLTYIATGTF